MGMNDSPPSLLCCEWFDLFTSDRLHRLRIIFHHIAEHRLGFLVSHQFLAHGFAAFLGFDDLTNRGARAVNLLPLSRGHVREDSGGLGRKGTANRSENQQFFHFFWFSVVWLISTRRVP